MTIEYTQNPRITRTLTIKKWLVLLVHALVGWAFCGTIIFIGRSVTTMENTLVIHAIGVPIIFGVLSWIYHRFFHYTTPLQTAGFFVIFAILMDFIVIAAFVEKSYVMFTSILGTWIPFTLIFLSTYLVGLIVTRSKKKL